MNFEKNDVVMLAEVRTDVKYIKAYIEDVAKKNIEQDSRLDKIEERIVEERGFRKGALAMWGAICGLGGFFGAKIGLLWP